MVSTQILTLLVWILKLENGSVPTAVETVCSLNSDILIFTRINPKTTSVKCPSMRGFDKKYLR